MANDVAPIIIKRKKKGGGDGHHGGAWKVAYADFVTAMMAFFLLMWLLNATTEQQRKGLADFFQPTAPINRVSGGGNGAFGGDSVFSENTLSQNGTGASAVNPTTADQARGETGNDDGEETQFENDSEFESMEEELLGKGGESEVMDNLLEHIVTRITDEGLVVELFSTETRRLFSEDGSEPTDLLRALITLVQDSSKMVQNNVAIGAHVPVLPLVVAEDDRWEMSGIQATAVRNLLEGAGMEKRRIERVTGHADREPIAQDPLSIRNNRVEIVFLRE